MVQSLYSGTNLGCRDVFKLKRSYENAVFSNQGASCKEKFTCDGVLSILFFRVGQVNRSQLKIHTIVAGANLIETYEFRSKDYFLIKEAGLGGAANNTYQFGQWYQSKASEVIIDFRWGVRTDYYWTQFECSNLHGSIRHLLYSAIDILSNYTLEVECRNIELLHNQDALVYFQRKS